MDHPVAEYDAKLADLARTSDRIADLQLVLDDARRRRDPDDLENTLRRIWKLEDLAALLRRELQQLSNLGAGKIYRKESLPSPGNSVYPNNRPAPTLTEEDDMERARR